MLLKEKAMSAVLVSTQINYAMMFALQKVNSINIEGFKPFFADLPVDPYIEGNYRTRRLSRFKIVGDNVIKLPHGYLYQSKYYNPLVGGIKREFAELDDSLSKLDELKQLIFAFTYACKLPHDGLEVGVHQIRTSCSPDNYGNPAPEGIHRDGCNFVGIFAVDRNNIEGGETHLYTSRKDEPVFSKVLNSGEFLVVNDNQFFHFTSSIKPASAGKGTRDVFVLTCPSLLND